jgi:hypothetical protein
MELKHMDDSRHNEIAATAMLPTVRLMGLFLDEQNGANGLLTITFQFVSIRKPN